MLAFFFITGANTEETQRGFVLMLRARVILGVGVIDTNDPLWGEMMCQGNPGRNPNCFSHAAIT